jgi:hypothetical protein
MVEREWERGEKIDRERKRERQREEGMGEGRAVCRNKGGIAEREGWRR